MKASKSHHKEQKAAPAQPEKRETRRSQPEPVVEPKRSSVAPAKKPGFLQQGNPFAKLGGAKPSLKTLVATPSKFAILPSRGMRSTAKILADKPTQKKNLGGMINRAMKSSFGFAFGGDDDVKTSRHVAKAQKVVAELKKAKTAAAQSKTKIGDERKLAKKVVTAVAKLKLAKDKKKREPVVTERATTRSKISAPAKASASSSKMKASAAKVK